MQVRFLGVRGSTPAAGSQFARYGGHTSCIAISHDGKRPRLVLDAGTGLTRLTPHLEGHEFAGTILLTHLHWDHTHGLPFFAAGDRPGAAVRVVMPAQGDAVEVMARCLGPPHFPIRPDELQGDWRYDGLEPGRTTLEGFDVLAREIPHKGGRTYGYRIAGPGGTVAYLPDHSPIGEGPGADGLGALHDAACELAQGVDVLIHDAQHTTEEFAARSHFGHSTIDYCLNLAEACGVGRLVLFHHDPSRTDDEIDDILREARLRRSAVDAAAEDLVVEVGERPHHTAGVR